MKVDVIQKVIPIILQNHNGRELVIWGVGDYAKDLEDRLKTDYNLNVAFYVDKNADALDNESVRTIDSLIKQKDKIYVICLLSYYKEIFQQLIEWGYEKNVDFIYFAHLPIEVKNISEYSDEYGNEVIGDIGAAKVVFYGKNSSLIVGENFKVGSDVTIKLYDDSSLIIGKNVTIGRNSNWSFKSKAMCIIGDDNYFNIEGNLICSRKSKIYIGDKCRLGIRYFLVSTLNAEIQIGNECLLANEVIIRTTDGHSIFDIHTGKNVNSDPQLAATGKNVLIGDHVWIGVRSIILYGTVIGSGSIVGATSFLKKKYPNNCIIAGIPARVIRKDIAWSKELGITNMDAIDDAYVNFTEECGSYY